MKLQITKSCNSYNCNFIGKIMKQTPTFVHNTAFILDRETTKRLSLETEYLNLKNYDRMSLSVVA